MDDDKKFVSQEYASRILGISQSRVSQMVRSGELHTASWRTQFSIPLEEVLRVQEARVAKILGKRPTEFVIEKHDHDRLRNEVDVYTIAQMLDVTLYKARRIMSGYMRTVSIGRGNRLYTLFAEVQRYRAQLALGVWQSYHTKINLAMTRYQFGSYDIEADRDFAETYVRQLKAYVQSLEVVTQRYIDQKRATTTEELTTVESREEWDAKILRDPPLAV